MSITEAQAKTLITNFVGDVDPTTGDPTTASSGVIASNIAILWDRYASAATISSRLRELYVERDCIKLVIAKLSDRHDFSAGGTGVTAKLRQQIDTRREQLKAAEEQLTIYLASLSSRRFGAASIGVIIRGTRDDETIEGWPSEI